MLGLKLPTDPRWVNIAEKNIKDILIDHAFCEQKAASTAISFIVTYPEYSDLVTAMIALVKEEISHFQLVHQKILDRGYVLGRERKDNYVLEIMNFFSKNVSREKRLIQRLLIAALIEARSCERFKVLSENINDQELAKFYKDLMVSEANHYTMFLNFARKYGDRKEVDSMWKNLLIYESKVISKYGKKSHIHG
ncbi:MAG: tRNA 2-methylthio-N6-isopentenyl adenosine(37) hydroxylase MiaE [Flavobacteriales bacterium]|nr:tRNA 2-methylthio-N6-isopentenyl adenosine(37) hydroxylase MiaE [Flavobacteriales bacterium]|tara:strand:- start:699 stop:1280 length:582 start_codon:yes stop_codon:yes gene_type:complete